MNLSESSKQRGPVPTEAVSEHGLGCAGSSEASTSWGFAQGAGIRGPDCQTWQAVARKVMLAASESAAGGFPRSDRNTAGIRQQ